MLKHIYIRNFVFIDTLELTLDSGVIMITGETGAGKSIILGAIDAALGQRNSQEKIKLRENEAEVILTFDLQDNQKAKKYLEENALNDDESSCIIRRVIYKDGKTRNFINGRPSNVSALRELGELLLLLHTQNENQILLNTLGQTQLLDAYADAQTLLTDIHQCVTQWKKFDSEMKLLESKEGEKNQRLDYLRYQHQELANANLDLEEIQALPAKHKALASAKETIELYENILSAFSPLDSLGVLDVLQRLRQPITAVEKLSSRRPAGSSGELSDLLNNAIVQIEELASSTKRLLNTVDTDPETLVKIEERMAELHQLARKHHVNAEELPQLLNSIEQEINNLSENEKSISRLKNEKTTLEKNYKTLAETLTKKRSQASKTLSKKVTQLIQELGMPTAIFSIVLETIETVAPNIYGAEQVTFMMKANTNYPEVPLKKTASGGELARVSLALQTLLAAYIQIPTLILDEIDVGVGGKIAAIIGQQLRKLGNTHQVICVTHQPQIAASGHQHLKVEKHDQKNQPTTVTVTPLNDAQRVDEIARMLGGLTITEHALQHAREMLASY
ncbi:MAG: DNA repair protein RecN [Gammaproteobacteria bacterium]|nr:DNA repair protein RecN [Gammaproteobacteria bacterium]